MLHQKNPFSPTVAFGVYFTRGSRDEQRSERGFSHLLEHTVFRGTRRRSALEIALELESIGGQWDAFTGREMTCYNGRVIEDHFPQLADIFADIILHPSLPPEAFRLERRVVQEEIRSIQDSPEEMAHELFFRTIFRRHPLGDPITGYQSDIARCTREDLLGFHAKTYTAGNACIGFVGNIPLDRVVSILDRRFTFRRKRRGTNGEAPGSTRGRVHSLIRKDGNQSHIVIGCRTVPAADERRYAVLGLANILGGGVSSRLFQSLRERSGLAYSVLANAQFWRDTGVLYIFFSVDPKKAPRALEIVRDDLESLRSGRITDAELASAKAQLKGSIVLGIESVEFRLFQLFHGEIYHGGYEPFAHVLKRIDRVTATEVSAAAAAFLAEKDLTYVTCGPIGLRNLVPEATAGSSGRLEEGKHH
ncbi:MAG TPA: pitrilysin family protein [Patescibacteria group bacterium]|nr:pitrilysin family protein [Patescibacteria group bacterium]